MKSAIVQASLTMFELRQQQFDQRLEALQQAFARQEEERAAERRDHVELVRLNREILSGRPVAPPGARPPTRCSVLLLIRQGWDEP